MKKFAFKVALISFLSALILLLLLLLGLRLFFPSVVADYYNDMGDSELALYYSEIDYKNATSFEKLIKVSERSIITGKSDKIIEYTGKLVADDSFSSYIENRKDGLSYYDYCLSHYVVAQYLSESKTDSELVDYAMSCSLDYRSGNAFSALIHTAAEKDDKELLQLAINKLENFKADCPTNSRTRLDTDLTAIKSIVNQ